MRIHATGGTLTLAFVLVLAGCGTRGATGTATPATGTNHPTSTETLASCDDPNMSQADWMKYCATATTAPEAEDTPEDQPKVLSFGETARYDDGLEVTVSAPVKFNPGEFAAGAGKNNVRFTVTIVNKTGSTFDPSMFSTSVQSSNKEAEEIYSDNLSGVPETKILNGRESEFKVGYAVADPKDIVMQVTPSFEHNSVMFQK